MLAHQRRGGSHSSRPWIAPRLQQPTRAVDTKRICQQAGAPPLFGLAPGGVCHAGAVASPPVRSCRTLSPLPVRFRRHRRYTLCGTFPRLRPEDLAGRALPATLVSWSPDFPRVQSTRGCPAPWRGAVYRTTGIVGRGTMPANGASCPSPIIQDGTPMRAPPVFIHHSELHNMLTTRAVGTITMA